MYIECLINRPGTTIVSVGGQFQYRFERNKEYPGMKVALVTQPAHQEFFLANPELYRVASVSNKQEFSAVTMNIERNRAALQAFRVSYNAGQITESEYKRNSDRIEATIRALEEKNGMKHQKPIIQVDDSQTSENHPDDKAQADTNNQSAGQKKKGK